MCHSRLQKGGASLRTLLSRGWCRSSSRSACIDWIRNQGGMLVRMGIDRGRRNPYLRGRELVSRDEGWMSTTLRASFDGNVRGADSIPFLLFLLQNQGNGESHPCSGFLSGWKRRRILSRFDLPASSDARGWLGMDGRIDRALVMEQSVPEGQRERRWRRKARLASDPFRLSLSLSFVRSFLYRFSFRIDVSIRSGDDPMEPTRGRDRSRIEISSSEPSIPCRPLPSTTLGRESAGVALEGRFHRDTTR